MNLKLFKKEIKENRLKFASCLLILGLGTALAVFLFPRLEGLIFSMEALAGEGSFSNTYEPADYQTANGFGFYPWGQWSSVYLSQAGAVIAIILGMGLFAQEKHKGTILFLASTPLSRNTIYNSKAVAGLFCLAACVFISASIFALSALFSGYLFHAGLHLLSALIIFSGLSVIFFFTMIFSITQNDPIKAGMASLFFWMILFFLGWIPFLHPYSFYHNMQAWEILLQNQFPWHFFLSMVFLALILRQIGLFIWNRMEIVD